MKTFTQSFLMMAIALIASSQAFAVSPTSARDSWTKILADRDLIVSTPYAGTFGPLGIFNACATDKEFKSISPVKVCTQYVYVPSHNEGDYPGHYDCVKSEIKETSMPRSGVQHTCVKQDMSEAGYPDCLEWADVAYTFPTTMKIEVDYGSGENYASFAFEKDFTVPACAQ